MGEVLGGRPGRAFGAALGWLLGLPVLALAWVGTMLGGPAGPSRPRKRARGHERPPRGPA